ncbi:MAG: monovalent cation:proton antiporter-2 (CPA2) family protein [Rickettsiales bacterium]
MDHGFLFNIFIFLATACMVVPMASKFKLGSVLGYLIAGIIIGPFGLSLIGNAEQIMHFGEFGVIMMLFVIGLELEPAALWRLRKSILGLGSAQVVSTSLAFTAIGMILGYSWQASLAAGMALSLSSTALVLQVLQEKNLMQTPVGETAFSVLLFQDIAVIPILIIMPLLSFDGASGAMNGAAWFNQLPSYAHALLVGGIIAMVIVAGRYLSHHLFYIVAKTNLREVFTATSLAVVVGITLLMQMVGMSPALGAFIAGVVLANSHYRRTLETDIEPFKGLLLGLFFISIGMGMDFSLLAQKPIMMAAAVLLLVSMKGFILYVLGKTFGLLPQHNSGFALALSQGGEFAFVLFQFAGGLDILPPEQAKFLTLAVAFSIATTPLLMLYYSKYVVPCYMSILPEREFDTIKNEHNPVILAGFGRFGQIIGRFLTAQGVNVTVLEKNPEQIELLRKFDFKGYFGDAARLDLLRSAGAEQAKLLVIAVDDANVCLEIAKMAKEEFPHLKIFARARNRRHAYELFKAGVEYFKRETFDSSLTMAQEIMIELGYNEADMRYKAQQFLQHDEAALRKSFDFFESEPELVNFSRLQRQELERILQSDSAIEERKAG